MSADRRHSLSSAVFLFLELKTKLLDTDGRNFEKAEVTNVISGNLSNSGSGKQTVELKLLSGDHKGKIIQATSSQSYLFGAKCKRNESHSDH